MMEKLKKKIFRVINHKRRTAHITETKMHSDLRSNYSNQDKWLWDVTIFSSYYLLVT